MSEEYIVVDHNTSAYFTVIVSVLKNVCDSNPDSGERQLAVSGNA